MTGMMRLEQAVDALKAQGRGDLSLLFTGVSSDSRGIAAGDLFVALRGPNFDGHQFIAQARECGAAGAIVDHFVDDPLPQIVVDDTRLALGRLGAFWRSQFNGVVVGVTGSNGKTTVKEMISSILRITTEQSGTHPGTVLATEGNLNNDIGVPLMLLRLRPQHRFAVIEMGANHPGEIDYLSTLVQPDVAMITNAGYAHIEGFGGTLEHVARAKGEIWNGLKEGGTAVVNADDDYADYWRELVADHSTLTFGMTPGCDVTIGDGGVQWALEHGTFKNRFTLQSATHGAIGIAMSLAGRHNIMNALAAAAAALAAGAALRDVQAGLAAMTPVKGRLNPKAAATGQLLIDDSYNANPHSMNAAVDVLVQSPAPTILVMGDMGELGSQGPLLHYQVGERARQQGVTRLLATGPLCREAVRGFGGAAQWFESQNELIGALSAMLAQSEYRSAAVLVKGSRSARMERVVEALQARGAESC